MPKSPVTPEDTKKARLDEIRYRLSTPSPTPPLPGAPAASSGGNVTLEAIAELLKKEISPVQHSMHGLEQRMHDLTVSLDERLKSVESRLDGSEARIAKLEELVSSHAGHTDQDPLWAEIRAISAEMNKLKSAAASSITQWPGNVELTAVIGGLTSLNNVDEAWQWVTNSLWTHYGPQPTDIYSKGEFAGIVFAKLKNKEERDAAVKLLRKERSQGNGESIWAKPDQPLEVRSCSSFLFGLKWLLGQWGFDKKHFFIDILTT